MLNEMNTESRKAQKVFMEDMKTKGEKIVKLEDAIKDMRTDELKRFIQERNKKLTAPGVEIKRQDGSSVFIK